MVRYQRSYQLKKGGQHQHVLPLKQGLPFVEDEEESRALVLVCAPNYNAYYNKRTKLKILSLLFLSILSCSFILAPHLLNSSFTFSLLYSFGAENEGVVADVNAPLCSAISNGTICCDRSSIRSDVCIMKGDVRTNSASSSIFLYSSRNTNGLINYVSSMVEEDVEGELQHEKIKPYTRKWETRVMDTIDELDLILKKENVTTNHHCDVKHDVPAVFFSTGGYTGNVYHEFNDGILPLYITSQHLNKKVVLVILEYHKWWIMKYGDILSHLSDYPAIDFSGDKRTHCFPEAIVGLRIHDELTVDSSLMPGSKTIVHFRNILDQAYWPRIRGMIKDEEHEAQKKLREKLEKLSLSTSLETSSELGKEVQEDQLQKPKLVLLSRNGSRAITNEDLVVKMAEKIGFRVEVLRPDRTTELAKIYRVLNSSDVMVGVHGAAMTHFLFMKPGSVFIQVIPLGTDWAAESYYGEPARKLGLKYISYPILPVESSLYDRYDKDDPVLRDPASVTNKGWQYTKTVYLEGQNVRLHLRRFHKRLVHAYDYSINRMKHHFHCQSH